MNRGDGVSPLVAVENANGFAISFSYDDGGCLTGITDSAGRQLRVTCDEHGRLHTIVAPHPTEPKQTVTLVTYDYNRAGELVRCQDALGQAATYEYEQGLMVRETFKNGLSFYFEYNGTGPEACCIRTWGDGGIYDHKLNYDVAARRTVVTNSLGYNTTYQGNENGLVTETLDARGGVTLAEYTEFNELLRETNSLGHTTTYEYDERGNRVHTVLPDGAQLAFTYDEQDRCTQVTDAVGGQWQWQYNEVGQLAQRTDPTGNTDRFEYAHGLLHRIMDAAGSRVELLYDAGYNLREARTPQGTSFWLLDGWGRPFKLTDARGNVQWREYDLLGRPVKVYEPDGNVRTFVYDGLNNVVRAQDRHHDVQYAYRGMGRMIRRAEADTAVEFLHDTEEQLRAIVNEHGLTYRFEFDAAGDVVTETGFDGLARRYRRDTGGRVQEQTLATGQRTRYSYDTMSRVTEVIYADGTTETYRYRQDGALLAATNNTISVEFKRDVLGQVLQEIQGTHTVTSEYDALGRRLLVTSSLEADHLGRDANGDVEQMRAGNWQALFTRDAQGLELQRSLSGGVHQRWRRDQLGRPVEQRISTGVGRASDRVRTYAWQENDRLTQLQDSQHGLTRFEHDAWGNLTATTFGDGTRQLRQPDAVGNLFRTAERQDRRYGPAGQLLQAGGTRYEWKMHTKKPWLLK
ncbi:RHS repeat domain-containing protein [Hymenobacter weizhouensis]|uniref:hypothetical protein n=1 Tax=Hymenobacter sp. YIM 151500-1 TaxID=2987689 RepID=UPI0022262E44|nr:hypothetical protein [Hymenobacter sp. YIM 151500-1]UYZ62610.1 hypothetical protein OIS53_16610 [Hymenobacter sp. YIM 151500-1]